MLQCTIGLISRSRLLLGTSRLLSVDGICGKKVHWVIDNAQLVKQALCGDEGAFITITRKYSKMVYGVAYSMLRDHHLAEDVSQEVFLRAYLFLPELRDPDKLGSWLYSIDRQVCSRFARRLKQAEPLNDEQVINTISPESIEEQVICNERRREVWTALANLSEGNRQVVVLHYMGDYSTGEIGRILNVSTDAVKSRLRRARRSLEQEMMQMVADEMAQHAPSVDVASRIEAMIAQINQLKTAGKLKEVIELARAGINLQPDNKMLHETLAHALSWVGDNDKNEAMLAEAEAEYKALLDEDGHASHSLGYVYLHQGRIDDAIACFEKLVNNKPDGRIPLAQALAKKGEWEQVMTLYQEVTCSAFNRLYLAIDGMLKAANRLGNRDFAKKCAMLNVTIAEEALHSLIGPYDVWRAYEDLASVQMHENDCDSALRSLHKAKEYAIMAGDGDRQPTLLDRLQYSTIRSMEGPEIKWFLKDLEGKRYANLKGHLGFDELVEEVRKTVNTAGNGR